MHGNNGLNMKDTVHVSDLIILYLQDTVLALQSLSEFAAMVYSNNFDLQITVKAGTFSKQFQVNPTNALILQATEVLSNSYIDFIF